MPLFQAFELAKKQGLDIVEVSAVGVPPVCRLMNYGKFRYEQDKKSRAAGKGQKLSLLREIRIRPNIGDHDFEAKARLGKKLVAGGDKLKVTMVFRGREITHPELGLRQLQRMAESLKDVASLDAQPAMDGNRMVIILSPIGAQKVKGGEKVTSDAKT